MSRTKKRLLLIVGAATVLAVAAPVPAGAKAELKEAKEKHCVVYVVDKTTEGQLAMSSPTCFATPAEAAELAATPVLKAQTADIDGMAFGYSTFTIGIHYDGANGTGSSITVVGSSCTGGWWNTPGWFDNKTSSSYNGCYRLRHYDKPNRGGMGYNTYTVGQTDNIASYMNNRTESVAYYSS